MIPGRAIKAFSPSFKRRSDIFFNSSLIQSVHVFGLGGSGGGSGGGGGGSGGGGSGFGFGFGGFGELRDLVANTIPSTMVELSLQ